MRIQRLERTNRRLCWVAAVGVAFPVLTLAGFQQTDTVDLVRAKKIEVVDSRGIPFITLEPTRANDGGSITLRDGSGDRRAWFTSGVGTARLGMVSGDEDSPTSTLGLNVEPKQSHVSLSSGRASANTSVDEEQPHLELIGHEGRPVFYAPVRTSGH